MKQKHADINQWVTLYTKDLLSWAYHKTSNLHTAEDLVQDTFIAAVESISSFRNESQPKTWLIGILNNKITDYYRKKTKRNHLALDTGDGTERYFGSNGHWLEHMRPQEWDQNENVLDNIEFVKIFHSCLEGLPTQWNACITMKYLSEKKTEIICQELELSTTNYWQIIHRAKLQLRHCLEHNWFREEEGQNE